MVLNKTIPDNLTTLVLCGGYGTRLRTATRGPKILAPVGNEKCFADVFIPWLIEQTGSNLKLLAAFKANQIIDWVETSEYRQMIEVLEGKEGEGTFVPVRNAILKQQRAQDYLIINGDTFFSHGLPSFDRNNSKIFVADRDQFEGPKRNDEGDMYNAGLYFLTLKDAQVLANSSKTYQKLDQYFSDVTNGISVERHELLLGKIFDIGCPGSLNLFADWQAAKEGKNESRIK